MYFQPDPDICSKVVEKLSDNELKAALNDDDKFEEVLRQFPKDDAFEKCKEEVMTSNRSLAEYNLSKEPALVENRERVHELAEQGQQLYNVVEQKINDLKTKSGPLSLEDAYNSLQLTASNLEQETEALFDHFMSNDLDVEQFLDDFCTKRKSMHIFKVKVDKMKELMTRRPSISNNSSPNYVNTHIGSPNYVNTQIGGMGGGGSNFYPPMPYPPLPNPAAQPPYPMAPGMMNMPMPGIYRNHF